VLLQETGRAAGGHQGVAAADQLARDRDQDLLVAVAHAQKGLARPGHPLVGRFHRLGARAAETPAYAHDLAGGAHFGTQDGIDSGKLDERENGSLME
jgi:hypothetical protein